MTVYAIEGMSCGACVQRVTQALQDSVETVRVTLSPPRAEVDGGKADDLAALNAAVAQAGKYKLSPVAAGDVATRDAAAKPATAGKTWAQTYYPLLLIVGLITAASFKGAYSLHDWMLHFMAGFFIVFGFFKLLDIRGFRDAYAGYDLLAKRVPDYGLVYPFIELALGFMFLFNIALTFALWASMILMLFGSIGVIAAVRRKQAIRCACLGTALNLPMSTITIVEDLGMAAMSAFMIAAL